MTDPADPIAEFIDAACVPLDSGHASGTLDRAEAMLTAHPGIARASIHTAAILGDEAGVRRFLGADARSATIKGGPRGWDALTHLCFSRYLRLDGARHDGFVRAAEALLDAGASAKTGWFEKNHQPGPEWESALYGAAGVAHHPELTRLLLERGADPNDNETAYHTPESYDNRALKVLVESGRMSAENLALMLIRKHDWHDYEGVKYLLDQGANPNGTKDGGLMALRHALARDNALAIVELLLDHGADPTLMADGRSLVAIAARAGRRDVLESIERRGIAVDLHGVDRLIAACARNDALAVRSLVDREPGLVTELLPDGGALLAEFAGIGNVDGVRHLLDLGVDVQSPYAEGDGYFGVAKNSLALHVAAWRAHHAIVKLLIERGSPIDVPDANGRTALALAVRACVDSYWSDRRSPESVEALLRAGASVNGVDFPSGYAEVDELLRSHA